MIKQRREIIALYEQGSRPELAQQEAEEIAVIEGFLPQADERGGDRRPRRRAAIAETGAAGIKDMGRVMAALQASATPASDGLAKAGAVVKQLLG